MFVRKTTGGNIDRDVNIIVNGEVLTIELIPNENSTIPEKSVCTFDLEEFMKTKRENKRDGNELYSTTTKEPNFTLNGAGSYILFDMLKHLSIVDMSIQLCVPFTTSKLADCSLNIRTRDESADNVNITLNEGILYDKLVTSYDERGGFDFTIPMPNIIGVEEIHVGESEGYVIRSEVGTKNRRYKDVWDIPMKSHTVYLSCNIGQLSHSKLVVDDEGYGEFTYYPLGAKSGDVVTIWAGLHGRPEIHYKVIKII